METITAIWLGFVVLVGNLERQHLARIVDAAETVKIGESETELATRLGPPIADYKAGWSFFLGEHPRQWFYGTTLDLDMVFVAGPYVGVSPIPIHIRLFGYSKDDLVIDLDSHGRVTKVEMPEIRYETSKRYDGILNFIYLIRKISEQARGVRLET